MGSLLDSDTVDGQHASSFAATVHQHDSRYYTETETDSLLAGKSDTSHNHDARYYTETEINTLIAALTQDKNYYYTQATPATVWTIPHNLGKRPSVSVIDTGNNVVWGKVEYPDLNTVIFRSSVPFSGTATLN